MYNPETKIKFSNAGGFYKTYRSFFEEQEFSRFKFYKYYYDGNPLIDNNIFIIIDIGWHREGEYEIYVLQDTKTGKIYLNNLQKEHYFTIVPNETVMTIKQIEEALNISNLKIVKE